MHSEDIIIVENVFRAKLSNINCHSSCRAGQRRTRPPELLTSTSSRPQVSAANEAKSRQPASVARLACAKLRGAPGAHHIGRDSLGRRRRRVIVYDDFVARRKAAPSPHRSRYSLP